MIELSLAILVIFLWEIFDTLVMEGALIAISVLFLFFLIKHKRIRFPQIYVFVLILGIHFIICFINGTATAISFLKQLLGVSITMIYYYNIVFHFGINRVMHKYCDIAFFFACYGLIQEILGLVNINMLVSFDWLITGIKDEKVLGLFQRCVGFCSEPFNFAMLLLPAFYIAIIRMHEKKSDYYSLGKALVLILAYVCTFSSIGYVGGFFAIWLLATKNKLGIKSIIQSMTGIVIIFALFLGAYYSIPEFTMRVNETFYAWTDINNLSQVNLSSYALVSNFYITVNMFKATLGLGVGWGAYGINYGRYSGDLDKNSWMYGINYQDANSMLFRMVAEIGILFFIIIIYMIWIRKKTPFQNKDISNAMLSIIILKLMRSGNYIFGGTMFFFCIYYLCAKKERVVNEDIRYNYSI